MKPEEKQLLDDALAQNVELRRELEDLQIQFEQFRAYILVNNAFIQVRSVNPNFQLRLPNLAANPAVSYDGALAVVGGKLKVYTGGAWVVVGTQT